MISHLTSAHTVDALEVMASVGDERCIRRMVDRLNSSQPFDQLWVMSMHVFHQFGLGIGWSSGEHLAGIGDGDGNLMEEILILRGVTAADRIRLVMDMAGWIVGVQNKTVDVIGVEMKYPCLAMIDPDDCMIMCGHASAPF
jgi:hypothetical protein